MATRDELVATISVRYGRSNRAERGRILDEFVAVTGSTANMPRACLAAVCEVGGLGHGRHAVSTIMLFARR